jgi:hypothetical protein
VEVGYLGAVAIQPVKIIFGIFLVMGQLHELTLVRCILGVLKEIIVMLVNGL